MEIPTPWCAGIVVVLKSSREVQICVDLNPLNESVLREVHPLPKVETTLAQLSGAKLFVAFGIFHLTQTPDHISYSILEVDPDL